MGTAYSRFGTSVNSKETVVPKGLFRAGVHEPQLVFEPS